MRRSLLLALVCGRLVAVNAVDCCNYSPLRFRDDGTFKIVQFTDMHFGEDAEKDEHTKRVQRTVLRQERPDLVVLTGDMVSGCAWNGKQGWFASKWLELVKELEVFDVPYATTLGNHDDEADLLRRQIVELEWGLTNNNLSRTCLGPPSITGASNYYINIMASKATSHHARTTFSQQQSAAKAGIDTRWHSQGYQGTANSSVALQHNPSLAYSGHGGDKAERLGQCPGAAALTRELEQGGEREGQSTGQVIGGRLWFLDSMDRSCSHAAGWGCVAQDTLQWAQQVESQLPHATVKLLFSHIPLPEYMTIWNAESTWGHKQEAVNCPAVEPQTYKYMRQMGLDAMYAGHDHNNDYYGSLNGIRLAYGRKTGHGSYGPPPGWQCGARVILLREGQRAHHSETWLRLENGVQELQRSSKKSWWWPFKQYVCQSG